MTCTDCHTVKQLHGDGTAYMGRRDVANKPSCTQCHSADAEVSDAAKEAHKEHGENVSCSACHTGSEYRQCSSCHLGEGAGASPAMILGDNPRKSGQLTTLRLIPTVRDTFKKVGIEQKNFDALPNYWDTVPHNVKKRTDRTRDCTTCHGGRQHFLEEETIFQGASKKNLELIHSGY
jgi:hypothetical protein